MNLENRPFDYKSIFDDYTKVVTEIIDDISFWKLFLDQSIGKYKSVMPNNDWIRQSSFSINNWPISDNDSCWLHASNLQTTIRRDDLDNKSDTFFIWVMNLSLVRIHNALEILLLRAITLNYFPILPDPIKGKNETKAVTNEIIQSLINAGKKPDTKNNHHIISFLTLESADISLFYKKSIVPKTFNTNWTSFFKLVSILRHVIAHHAMIVTGALRNEINSIAKDVYGLYFEDVKIGPSEWLLTPVNDSYFLNFVNHINDFAGNTLKFIAGAPDLKILGLLPVEFAKRSGL